MTHIFRCLCGRQGRAPTKVPTECPKCDRVRTYAGRGPVYTERDVRFENAATARKRRQKKQREEAERRRREEFSWEGGGAFGVF